MLKTTHTARPSCSHSAQAANKKNGLKLCYDFGEHSRHVPNIRLHN